mmetsp:Transcript_62100/g.76101  ORF Transcript_62100/g.76101 Transcript_62100/m.76101 type:complete len:604 (-) Transcript_62100:40-1851(-)
MSAFSKQKALELIEDRFDIDTRKAVLEHWNDEDFDSDTLGDEFADSIDNDDLLPNDLENLDQVFKLLHNFAKGINAQSNATKFNFNRINFDLSNKDKKKYKEYYKNQCKTLVTKGKDQSLLHLLCMGAKNQYPLMMNLVDSFTRQTIYNYIDDRKNNREINDDYKFSKFNTDGTNFFSTLKKNGKPDVANNCLQGCVSYFKRSFVPFKFSIMPTIKDDYYNICNIILDVILTINGAFKDNEANELAKRFFHTPFQLDLVFILNSVDKNIQKPIDDDPNDADPDGDNGDDSDDAKENKNDTDSDDEDPANTDSDRFISDIERSLKHSKYSIKIGKVTEARAKREQLYKNKLMELVGNRNNLNKKRVIVGADLRDNQIYFYNRDGDDNFNLQPSNEEIMYEKFFGLLQSFVAPNVWFHDDSKGDDQYFPEDIRKNNALNENTKFFKNILGNDNVIIMDKLKKHAKDLKDLLNKNDDELKKIIKDIGCVDNKLYNAIKALKAYDLKDLTARMHHKKVLIVSFHVHSKDEIKGYMLWNGSCLRFYPKDLITFWPYFFEYTKSIKGESELKLKLNALDLYDPKFMSFCESTLKNAKIIDDMKPYYNNT